MFVVVKCIFAQKVNIILTSLHKFPKEVMISWMIPIAGFNLFYSFIYFGRKYRDFSSSCSESLLSRHYLSTIVII